MHLSPSQLYKFLNCEASWGFKYIDKIPEKVGLSLLYGHCFDVLTNQVVHSLNAGIEVSSGDVEELWESAWYSEFEKYEVQPDDDVDFLYNNGIELSQIFLEEYASTLIGAEIQPDLSFDMDGYRVEQRADFLLPTSVIDIKTAAKTPSRDGDGKYIMSAFHKMQTLSYAVGAIRRGHDILVVETIVGVKNKKPKIVRTQVEVTPEELDFIIKQYEVVSYKVKNHNNVLTANRLSMMCSRKNCSYWNLCEEKYGGKVK